MDNIQDSVAAPTGEAQQPVEQMPNVQADGATSEVKEASTETTFNELAAKKGWKTPDDLAKAYANLEGHSTKTSQEKSELEKAFFNAKPNEQTSVATDDVALQELDKFVNQRVTNEISKIRAEWQDRESRRELRDTIDKNPDFGKYAQDVKELKSKYPGMPFDEAYTVAKALKGDLATQAKAEGMKLSVEAVQRQTAAQVAPEKKGAENKIAATDLLQGAGKRWTADNRGHVDHRAHAEIEMVERELFGTILQKTQSGL